MNVGHRRHGEVRAEEAARIIGTRQTHHPHADQNIDLVGWLRGFVGGLVLFLW
jgi:hypothetical protein